MDRDETLQVLSDNREELSRFGIKSIAVFGSVARGEATRDSDVDILVEFHPEERVGIFRFLELKEHLEGLFGREVDLVTPAGLKPRLRDGILAEAVVA